MFVVRLAVGIAFPHALRAAMDHILDKKVKPLMPGKATLHRARLALDAALMLVHRQAIDIGVRIIRLGSADSSPQHQRDWLLCSYDWLKWDDVLKVAAAVDDLVKMRWAREEAHGDDSESGDELSDDDDDLAAARG